MYTKNGMLSRASHTVDDNPHSSQVCKCLCIFHNQVGPQYEWDVGRQDGIHRVLPSTPTSWDRQACCRDIQSGDIRSEASLSSRDSLSVNPHIFPVSTARGPFDFRRRVG